MKQQEKIDIVVAWMANDGLWVGDIFVFIDPPFGDNESKLAKVTKQKILTLYKKAEKVQKRFPDMPFTDCLSEAELRG